MKHRHELIWLIAKNNLFRLKVQDQRDCEDSKYQDNFMKDKCSFKIKLNSKISKLIEERRSTIQEQTEDDDIIDIEFLWNKMLKLLLKENIIEFRN